MPSYTMSFSCVKIKRASLERDFYTALFVYNGINLHTVRHKSVLHNIYPSQSHHPATKKPSLPKRVLACSTIYRKKSRILILLLKHIIIKLHLYWYSHMFIPYFFCIIFNRIMHYKFRRSF